MKDFEQEFILLVKCDHGDKIGALRRNLQDGLSNYDHQVIIILDENRPDEMYRRSIEENYFDGYEYLIGHQKS